VPRSRRRAAGRRARREAPSRRWPLGLRPGTGASHPAAPRTRVAQREPLPPLLQWASVTCLHRSSVAVESLACARRSWSSRRRAPRPPTRSCTARPAGRGIGPRTRAADRAAARSVGARVLLLVAAIERHVGPVGTRPSRPAACCSTWPEAAPVNASGPSAAARPLVLLHRAISNAGDFLIRDRMLRLLTRHRPEVPLALGRACARSGANSAGASRRRPRRGHLRRARVPARDVPAGLPPRRPRSPRRPGLPDGAGQLRLRRPVPGRSRPRPALPDFLGWVSDHGGRLGARDELTARMLRRLGCPGS